MKILQISVLILALVIFANSQTSNKSFLSGILADETGNVIPNTKVKATNLDKKVIEVLTNGDGFYQIELENGIYSIEFESVGFKIYKIENYNVAPLAKGTMNLDIVLKVRDCNDPLVNCDVITGEPLKNKNKSKIIKKRNYK